MAFAAPAGYVSCSVSGSNFSNSLAAVDVAGSVMVISEIGNADALVALIEHRHAGVLADDGVLAAVGLEVAVAVGEERLRRLDLQRRRQDLVLRVGLSAARRGVGVSSSTVVVAVLLIDRRLGDLRDQLTCGADGVAQGHVDLDGRGPPVRLVLDEPGSGRR